MSQVLKRPEAVLFDFGETLWHFPCRRSSEEIRLEAVGRIRAHGGRWASLPKGVIEKVVKGIQPLVAEAEDLSDQDTQRSPDYVAVARLVASSYGLNLNRHEAEELWLAWNVGGLFLGLRLYPDTLATLTLLRDRGYRLGAITNRALGGEPFRRQLRHIGLFDYFEVISISSEVGWRKPHRAIFSHALDGLAVEPGASVMVGDRLETDVKGAREMGMTTVLMRNGASRSEVRVRPDFNIDRLSQLTALPILSRN